jgi:hypothetical protein
MHTQACIWESKHTQAASLPVKAVVTRRCQKRTLTSPPVFMSECTRSSERRRVILTCGYIGFSRLYTRRTIIICMYRMKTPFVIQEGRKNMILGDRKKRKMKNAILPLCVITKFLRTTHWWSLHHHIKTFYQQLSFDYLRLQHLHCTTSNTVSIDPDLSPKSNYNNFIRQCIYWYDSVLPCRASCLLSSLQRFARICINKTTTSWTLLHIPSI